MGDNILFQDITTKEEFFTLFQGLCNTAESAFNQFEKEYSDITKDDQYRVLGYCKNLSYLMSITFVIMGMRGDYSKFMVKEIQPFNLEKDGFVYDQKYLYKMNDYFAKRFNSALSVLESIDPASADPYKKVWATY